MTNERMTNEEAIRMLKANLECMTRDVSGFDDDCNRKLCGECHLNYEKGTMGEQKEYLRMSIKALERELEELPSVTQKSETVTEFADRCRECGAKYGKLLKQQTCGDAISRQAVLDILKDKWNMFSDANDAMQESIDTIKLLRPVTPQQKVGHWIDSSNGWMCSECKRDNIKDTNYCPNCGSYNGGGNNGNE